MTRGELHHVEINVSDLSRSSEFWGWLLEELGYVPYESWDGGRSWRLGTTYVVFVQTTERFRQPPYDRRRTGLNHLAFHAASRADVDELARRLRERGVPLLYQGRFPNEDHYAVYFEDPDRIKVEVVAPS